MKYWKITNEEENHNGMQYQDGWNTDIQEFNSSPECGGGLFFASRDILGFLGYGCYVREVTFEETEEVIEINSYGLQKFKAHKIHLGERRKWNDLTVFKELVENGANIHALNDSALRYASFNGLLDIVKFLVEQGADIHVFGDEALRHASGNGHLEVVKFLVEQGADIHAMNDYALQNASKYGHLEVVKYLVENGADIHADNDYALQLASNNGYSEVVEYLKSLDK
jgi:hypothetical protein